MDQIIQALIDQDNFLAECEAKANNALEIAERATDGLFWQVSGNSIRTVRGFYFIGECREHVDAKFIAHARTSNPELAACVLALVKMVRERDERIAKLSEPPKTHRCVNCRLYMSDDQEKCPNCGADQGDE